MKSTTSAAVITCLSTIFAEHGTPEIVFSDNGPQFVSEEYKEFSQKFGFLMEQSSPRYPQANGFIESMVKVVKDLFRRASLSGEDPQLSIQAYRATPLSGKLPSPAEVMFGRKIQTVLPIRNSLTSEQQATREIYIQGKLQQQHYYDLPATEMSELQQHQKVLVQLDPLKRSWKPAVIVRTPEEDQGGPRTYTVQTEDGGRYPRNRRFLRASEAGASTQDVAGATEDTGATETPGATEAGASSTARLAGAKPKTIGTPSPRSPRAMRNRRAPIRWDDESIGYKARGRKILPGTQPSRK
jgi:hypothetical protein